MEWLYQRRRGPEWKQGWTGQKMASISTPPLQLLTVFLIVIVLLWFSQLTGHKSQLHHTAANFQLFLFLLPVLVMIIMASYSMIGRLSLRLQTEFVNGTGASPWGVAIFLVMLLVLLSYQSSFNSKLFGS